MAGKRAGKSSKPSESQASRQADSAQHPSGMSVVWQAFYEQVRRVVAEAVQEQAGNGKSNS